MLSNGLPNFCTGLWGTLSVWNKVTTSVTGTINVARFRILFNEWSRNVYYGNYQTKAWMIDDEHIADDLTWPEALQNNHKHCTSYLPWLNTHLDGNGYFSNLPKRINFCKLEVAFLSSNFKPSVIRDLYKKEKKNPWGASSFIICHER